MGIDRGTCRAVFLDRDGVINRAIVRDGKPYPPATVDAVEILPGVADGLARLRDAGFRLVVVTNQPDIARGTQVRDVVETIHAHLAAMLPIDEFRVCAHDDDDACTCRKPKPGMLKDAARAADIDVGASFMVGDRWRDIEAGRAAGCRTVFIDHHYEERRPQDPDVIVPSFPDAVNWILTRGQDPA
jgi:D-glycero-D-manno-heptose 1,7-bisphosphate phosphatase